MAQIQTSTPGVSRRAALWSALRALAAAPLLPGIAQAQSRGTVVPGPAREAGVMLASLTDGVYINANESPLGPCAAARTALERTPVLAGRYGMSFEADLEKLFAVQNGLKPENVKAHPGSFVPLRTAALAFASDSRPMAYCTPTFDSGFFGANNKAMVKVVKVPVDAQYRVDVRAMLAAAPNAGAFYICNPNNPTGLVTPYEDIQWLLANKPKDAKGPGGRGLYPLLLDRPLGARPGARRAGRDRHPHLLQDLRPGRPALRPGGGAQGHPRRDAGLWRQRHAHCRRWWRPRPA